MGDRTPAVRRMFGVESQVNTHVFTAIHQCRMARPRSRNHDRSTGSNTVSQGRVDTHVGGVARAEIVARQDHQTGVAVVAEAFGELAHAVTLPEGTGSPESTQSATGVGFGCLQVGRQRHVRPNRENPRHTLGEQLTVHE